MEKNMERESTISKMDHVMKEITLRGPGKG